MEEKENFKKLGTDILQDKGKRLHGSWSQKAHSEISRHGGRQTQAAGEGCAKAEGASQGAGQKVR